MSFFSESHPFASGPSDPETGRNLLARLQAGFGADWKARGYELVETEEGFDVVGDTGQFYLDAVADDVHASLAMAFLARFARQSYDAWREEARDDMIDLDESQDVFLQDRPIEFHLSSR